MSQITISINKIDVFELDDVVRCDYNGDVRVAVDALEIMVNGKSSGEIRLVRVAHNKDMYVDHEIEALDLDSELNELVYETLGIDLEEFAEQYWSDILEQDSIIIDHEIDHIELAEDFN